MVEHPLPGVMPIYGTFMWCNASRAKSIRFNMGTHITVGGVSHFIYIQLKCYQESIIK